MRKRLVPLITILSRSPKSGDFWHYALKSETSKSGIGGQYFDVLNGTYELERIDDKNIGLHFFSHFITGADMQRQANSEVYLCPYLPLIL